VNFTVVEADNTPIKLKLKTIKFNVP